MGVPAFRLDVQPETARLSQAAQHVVARELRAGAPPAVENGVRVAA